MILAGRRETSAEAEAAGIEGPGAHGDACNGSSRCGRCWSRSRRSRERWPALNIRLEQILRAEAVAQSKLSGLGNAVIQPPMELRDGFTFAPAAPGNCPRRRLLVETTSTPAARPVKYGRWNNAAGKWLRVNGSRIGFPMFERSPARCVADGTIVTRVNPSRSRSHRN
jgi:hypothetical protein